MAKKEIVVRPVTSILGTPVKVFYGPDDLSGFDYQSQLNDPGEFPFTRGVFPTMYRSELWTMRQYSGQSTSESTNERFKYLLKNGYIMMQYSIYSKILQNRDTVCWHLQELEKNLPSDGSVMVMTVTEKQYRSIQNLVGSKKALDRKITSKKMLIF